MESFENAQRRKWKIPSNPTTRREKNIINSMAWAFQWLYTIPFYICTGLPLTQTPTDGITLCKLFTIVKVVMDSLLFT